jgi:hypothetical protein
MILEIENFLPKSFCEKMIEFIEENSQHAEKYGASYVLQLNRSALSQPWNEPKINPFYGLFINMISEVRCKFDDTSVLNYFQAVKWPTNSGQNRHVDHDYHSVTSIIYLNDNFTGGETWVDGKVIEPIQGKMVVFRGNKILHGVNEVTEGVRYTIPAWYKSWSIHNEFD